MYLLPAPQKMFETSGICTITYDCQIILDASLSQESYDHARLLQQEILESTGIKPDLSRQNLTAFASLKACILLTIIPSLKEEGYTLDISENAVRIQGNASAGLLYGIQTLRQIIRQYGAQLPGLHIEDYPAVSARGYYFDTTRGRVPTLESLKKLADSLSFYKLNQLQLYIEHSYLFPEFSEMWRDDTPLTASEIMELDQYCTGLHIELVPSLASFGHLYKLLRTKSYSHLCELDNPGAAPFSYFERMQHHTVDVTNPETFTMIRNMLTEYMQLFTSRYFNICADETFDLGKGKSRKAAEKDGVSSIYTGFLKQLADFVIENGRTPMFWSDIICEDPTSIQKLPPEMICLHWDYAADVSEARLKKLTDAGAKKLYVCPGVQSWDHLIPRYHDAYENISRMCSYGHKAQAIGVLNTDWGDHGHINHPLFSRPGLIYGAAFSWNETLMSEEEINHQISVLEYGDETGTIVDTLRKLSECEAASWKYVVWVKENCDQLHDQEKAIALLQDCPAQQSDICNSEIDDVLKKLYGLLRALKPDAKPIASAYILAAEGQKLFNTLLSIMKSLLSDHESTHPASSRSILASALEKWLYDYHKLWITTSKESEYFHIAEVIFWYADYLREFK